MSVYRTKIFRMIGEYYWLIEKQGTAIKWWSKAIKEGIRLGARPDLWRTYFKVGQRLLDTQRNYKELNGIDAKGYLRKAGVMFGEMDFQYDLDELERMIANT